jgi:hypothetical protein
MAYLPGGIIYLDTSDSSIGSDVEEIIKWDDCLRKTMTFSTAYMILVGRKYGSPLLDIQQTLSLNFVDQPAEDYCRQNSSRKQLKEGGRKKNPSKHTPPYSNFVSNVDNHAWRNGLSSEPMYLHQEARRNMTAAAAVTALAVLTATMSERVQKRVLDVFLNVSLPATKKFAAKVHAQLAHKDPTFTSVVD